MATWRLADYFVSLCHNNEQTARHVIRHFLLLVLRRFLLKQLWFWNIICSLIEAHGEKIHIRMCVAICLFCGVSLTLLPALWGAQKRFWRADWIFFSRPHLARFFPCPSGVCTCKQKPRAMASATGKRQLPGAGPLLCARCYTRHFINNS